MYQVKGEAAGYIAPPTGNRSPDRPARSQSLCRLSYRATKIKYYAVQIMFFIWDPVWLTKVIENYMKFVGL